MCLHFVVTTFCQVFEMLDRDGGGSIDAVELYAVMKDLDIDITLDEIKVITTRHHALTTLSYDVL